MVDAEFAVQFLVLSEAKAHPELVPNVGNIALLLRAEAAGAAARGRGPRRGRGLSRTAPRAASGPAQRGTDAGADELAGGRARGHAGAVEGGVWPGRTCVARAIALVAARRWCCWPAARADRAAAAPHRARRPDANPPSGLGQVPDAEPRVEAIRGSGGTSKPVHGARPLLRADHRRPAVPRKRPRPRGTAASSTRQSTASGEPYDMYAMTAAHKTLAAAELRAGAQPGQRPRGDRAGERPRALPRRPRHRPELHRGAQARPAARRRAGGDRAHHQRGHPHRCLAARRTMRPVAGAAGAPGRRSQRQQCRRRTASRCPRR